MTEHWTENQKTLEGFVLGRIQAPERIALDAHLRVCERCALAVRTEQELAAGVKRLGRDELKTRLQEHVGANRPLPWLRVAGVAAAVVVLVSIGVYNQWFMSQWTGEEPVSESIVQQTEPYNERKPEVSHNDEVSRSQPARALQTDRAGKSKNNTRDEKTTTSDQSGQERAKQSVATSEQNSAFEGARVAPPQERPAKADQEVTQEIWLEGTADTPAPAYVSFGTKTLKDAVTPTEQMRLTPKTRAAERGGRQVMDSQLDGQNFLLIQQPLNSLPMAEQDVSSSNQTIPTHMKFVGETLELTIYLDSLLDEADISKAILHSVSSDSLVLVLPHKRIAYRVPLDWGAKLRTATQQR